MEGKQRLYYGLGQLAHVVAMADGKVQKEELKKMHEVMEKELLFNMDYSFSEIIFELLEKSPLDSETAFDNAFNDIESASYYLTDDMKSDFPAILEKVARAFPPYSEEEAKWIERIKERLEKI